MKIIFVFFWVAFSAVALRAETAEQVFLTQEAALKIVFPDADKVIPKRYTLSAQQRKKIETQLGWELDSSTVTVYCGSKKNQPQGCAVIGEEIGKFKPITFIVKVSNDKKVERVEVMVYREEVGQEVRRQRFTNQFKGKNAKSALRINRDIINITGATMSVQALTLGVKKVLLILDELPTQ